MSTQTARAQGQNPRPLTIPALREWIGSRGAFRLPRTPRLLVVQRDWRQLHTVAGTFADDLRRLTRRHVRVVRGQTPARAGDVRLLLKAHDHHLGREGYSLAIGDGITIRARTATGIFYGTRTVLQLLNQGALLPRGRARDWPRYPERGLMIDLGRRIYPARWIEAQIKGLAYLKLNQLHLHLTDDERWGLQSVRYPELASPGALTRREMRAIIALATRYHVIIVPEIDMPGHMGALLAKHPRLELRPANGAGPPASTGSRKLDITNPTALRTARQLLAEYLPLFPGPYWEVGADEYLTPAEQPLYPQLATFARQRYGPTATPKDAILGFVNSIDAIVRRHHKTLRAWHDELGPGAVISANTDIVVDWWTNISPLSDPHPPTPHQLLAGGHKIANDGWFPTYFTGDVGPIQGMPDMRDAYEQWAVDRFCGPTLGNMFLAPCSAISPGDPRNLGSTLNAWNDHDLTLAQIAAGLFPRLRVLSQKTWNSPPLTGSYQQFQSIMSAVGSSAPRSRRRLTARRGRSRHPPRLAPIQRRRALAAADGHQWPADERGA